MTIMPLSNPNDRNLIAGFSALALLAIALGGWVYAWQRTELLADTQNQLLSIARTQAGQITAWRDENLAAAQEIAHNPLVLASLQAQLQAPDTRVRSGLPEYFHALQTHHRFSNILLVNPAGRVVYSHHPTFDHLVGKIQESFNQATIRRLPVLSDIIMHEGNPNPHLHLILPVFGSAGTGGKILGALVLVIDARQVLYSRLQTWPVPSRSGETLLVRREGETLLYLNELRFRAGSALRLRFPITRENLPAAMAVHGKAGIVRGKDYRGVPVVAAIQPIPDFHWFIIAKMDVSELEAAMRWQLGLILGLTSAALLVLAAFGAWMYQQNRTAGLKLRLTEESKRLALISHFEYLVKYANDLILLADGERRLVEANDRALELYGLARGNLHERRLTDIQSQAEQTDQEGLWSSTKPGAVLYATTRPGAGGRTLELEISARTVRIGSAVYYQEIARDVTEKRRAESAWRESEKKYRLLFESLRDAVVVVAMDGHVLECNQTFQEILGYSAQELRRITYQELTPKSWRAQEQMRVEEQILPRGYSDVYEKEYIRKNGTVFPVELRAFLVRDRHGEPEAIWAIVRDITERKNAEEQIHRNARGQAMLAAAITELVGTREEAEIYEIVSRRLLEILPGSFVAISATTPDERHLRIRAVKGFDPHLGDIRRAIGFDLRDKEFPLADIDPKELQAYTSGKLIRHPEGIYLVLQKKVPQAVCRIIEKLLGVCCVFSIGFSWEGRHYGGAILLLRQEALPADAPVIETLVHQASLAIQRARAESALRQSEEKFRVISEHAGDVIWVLDLARQRFTYVSPSVFLLRGYTPEEVMAQSIPEALTPDSARAIMDAFPKRLSGYAAGDESLRVQHAEIDQPCRDGSIVRTAAVTTLLTNADGTVDRVLGVSRDITAQKQAEAEILRLNADLERRVRERTAELETANQELEAFAYSVSHDLRAPLRSIGGFSQALAEDIGGSLNPAARGHLDKITASVKSMGQIIEDLLRLSRIQRADLNREPVDLSALAVQILRTFHDVYPERAVDDAVAPGLVADGDPGLLRLLLENLLSNAWKFTGRRTRARIEFGVLPEGPERVYFIRDDGAGFDPRYAGKLFGVFQRLHSLAEFPGTGIGLATAQRILRRHGGRIWAEGAENQGAAFFFTLPGRAEIQEAGHGERTGDSAG